MRKICNNARHCILFFFYLLILGLKSVIKPKIRYNCCTFMHTEKESSLLYIPMREKKTALKYAGFELREVFRKASIA